MADSRLGVFERIPPIGPTNRRGAEKGNGRRYRAVQMSGCRLDMMMLSAPKHGQHIQVPCFLFVLSRRGQLHQKVPLEEMVHEPRASFCLIIKTPLKSASGVVKDGTLFRRIW